MKSVKMLCLNAILVLFGSSVSGQDPIQPAQAKQSYLSGRLPQDSLIRQKCEKASKSSTQQGCNDIGTFFEDLEKILEEEASRILDDIDAKESLSLEMLVALKETRAQRISREVSDFRKFFILLHGEENEALKQAIRKILEDESDNAKRIEHQKVITILVGRFKQKLENNKY